MAAAAEEATAHEEQAAGKPQVAMQLGLVVLGDCSVGKSTLAGHLVCKCGGLEKKPDEYASVMNAPADRRPAAQALLPAAAAGGAPHKISSERCCFTVAEAPSERERLKGLAASGFPGAADVALLLVSAAPGELEQGLSADGCTREHALLAQVLGAGQLVVGVSKMDATSTAYSEARFEEVKRALEKVLGAIGFKEDVPFIPISGLQGDSLFEHSEKMPWYKGPTLLQLLDAAERPAQASSQPLRVMVREAYHLDSVGAVAVGCVEQGVLRAGAQLHFTPGGATGRVKTVEVESENLGEAHVGQLATFALEGLGVEALRRGMVAAEPSRPAVDADTFLAHVVMLRGPGELRKGFSPVLAFQTMQVSCRIEELVGRLDRRTGDLCEACPSALRAGDVGLVRLRPEQPLCLEAYADCPRLGQFTSPPEQTAMAMVGVVCEVAARQPTSAAASTEVAVAGAVATGGGGEQA